MTSVHEQPRGRPNYCVRVAEATLVTPSMRRLRFEGEDLAGLAAPLPAQWMKVILAPPEASVRPNRAYTIRHLDPLRQAVTMDFVLHGDTGPLSAWAGRTQVGDTIYLGAPRGGHRIDSAARWRLLAGDETALPAIAAILEMLADDDVPTQVIVEVPLVADRQDLHLPRKAEIQWFARDNKHGAHGRLLESAVAALTLPEGPGHAFLAGEAGAIRAMKLDIAGRRPGTTMDAKGYWRLGASDHRDEPSATNLSGTRK